MISMRTSRIAHSLVLLAFTSLLLGCSKTELPKATIVTLEIKSITVSSAESGGVISSDNGSMVTDRGICWSPEPNPTLKDSVIKDDGDGTGTFKINLTKLNSNSTYYARAFAMNEGGTAYGNELNFTTQNGLISITTDAASSINRTSAIVEGTISGDGGSNITERGIYWSTSANPTLSGQKIVLGNGTGHFSKTMADLASNTTYYYCAYATNSIGTIFGNEVSFKTLAGVPKACFDYSISKIFTASFTNCSDYPTTCEWDFGDGTTSTEIAPTHVYGSLGTYTVKLSVSNDGLTDFATKVITVTDEISLNNIQAASEFLNGTYLDVDLDGIADFKVATWNNTSPSTSTTYSKVEPLNNYEIITDTASTRVENLNTNPVFSTYLSTIPKIYVLGNTIQPPFTTTKTGLFFANKQFLMVGKTTVCDIWIKSETRYMGFRKIEGGITKIGWIKLGVPGFATIVLSSFKVPSITESLSIK